MKTVAESNIHQTANAVVQAVPLGHAEIIAANVAAAVRAYQLKHPNLSAQDIEKFRLDIASNMQTSASRNVQDNATIERNARKAALQKAIDGKNIGFKSIRNKEWISVAEVLHGAQYVDKTNYIETSETHMRNCSTNKGGATLAYKLRTDAADKLFADVAVAVCRKDENFDALMGKEIAVTRLLEGKTISVELSHGSLFTNKLSDKELASLVNSYKDTFGFKEQN